MDIAFKLVMMDQSLFHKVEVGGTLSQIYDDVIVTSEMGGKAAIKDASIIHCFELDLTLLGGIFVFKEDLNEMNQRKIFER